MGLSPYERRSFYRFMAAYLGAGLIVIVSFSILFYRIDTESIKDRVFAHLRMEGMQIASAAIAAQMQKRAFEIPQTIKSDYLLLDAKGHRLDGTFKGDGVLAPSERIDEKGCAWFVDKGAHGHMGIASIVLRDCSYASQIEGCMRRVIWMAFLAYGFWVLVGWYLGRLFLQPMRENFEAMERFVKDSTHELNTPVTTMLLALERIEKRGLTPTYLEALKMSGRLISHIYEDLSFLLLSRHKIQAHRQPIDVTERVEKSIAFFSILAERKKITIVAKLSECMIVADAHHIDLLLKNLIDNAIKYTPTGGRVTIGLEAHRLIVEDNGEGIDKSKLSRIFDRFYRDSDTEGGFGIGLSIIKRVCEMEGFFIDVRSDKGVGSRFVITFPQSHHSTSSD